MQRTILPWVIVALAIVALSVMYTHVFNWGTPDDFRLVDWYRRFKVGDLDAWGFATLQNGPHPMAFGLVVTILLFDLFGVSFLVLELAITLLVFGTAMLIFDAARKTLGHSWVVASGLLLDGLSSMPNQRSFVANSDSLVSHHLGPCVEHLAYRTRGPLRAAAGGDRLLGGKLLFGAWNVYLGYRIG